MNLNGLTAAIAATGDALNAAELQAAQLAQEKTQLAQENDRLRARLAALSEPEPGQQEQTDATGSAVPPAST